MEKQMLDAVKKFAEGQIGIHKMNVKVYLNNPAGIGEHSDVMEAIVTEMKKIAEYDDVLDVVKKHFHDPFNHVGED
jgi:hypothetical protein